MSKLVYHSSRFLCYALSAFMTLFLALSIISFSVNVTLGNDEFLEKEFKKAEVITSLVSELESNFKDLSDKTGVPCSVFTDAAGYDFIISVQPSVIRSMHNTSKTDFSNITNLKNRYIDALNKYDKANHINRNSEDTDFIAEEAVKIFNSTCSIENSEQFYPLTKYMGEKLFIAGFVLIICFVVLNFAEYIISGKRRKCFNFTPMSVMAAGEILITLTLLFFLSTVFQTTEFTNAAAYNTALSKSIFIMMLIVFAAGIICILSALAIFFSNFKYYKRKLIECDTENEISRNIIKNNQNFWMEKFYGNQRSIKSYRKKPEKH